jgi:hypothetical protein
VPLVTVITAVYNRPDLVAQTLDSALRQTHPQIEVIVVDDGSTDATPAVLERFAGRIVVRRQPNQGIAAALNHGLRVATGDLVAFLDSDDLWDPPFLARLVARLAPLDDATVGAAANWREIDVTGRVVASVRGPGSRIYGLPELAVRPSFPPSGVLLRRRAITEAGAFDSHFVGAQDRDLWFRLAAAGGVFVGLDEVLWSYRVHAGALSRDPDSLRADGLRLIDKSFADPRMPEHVRQRRGEALGVMWSGVSARLFERGRDAEGRQALCDAVCAWPDVLREDETYWSILCAAQPIEDKAGPLHLDLERATGRLFDALAAAVAAAAVDPALARHAHGRAHRALAQLAYGQRRMRTVRAHTFAAVRADPALWRQPQVVKLWLKSLAGATAVDVASRWLGS